ncbi:MAG: HNH endonuclease [Flavobacteriales bacterium]|nr:HNH endonuclease [Flavobacteriales bacterium]
MTDFNWKYEIQQWTNKKRKIKPFQSDLVVFFETAFKNTTYPDRALFGTNDYSISLLTGGIFFAAYTREGVIWLLLDRQFKDIPNSDSKIVKSTKTFSEPLFWLETENLNNLKILIDRQDIWDSFKIATERIYYSKMVTSHRVHIAKNKITLADFYSNGLQNISSKTVFEIEKELEEKVKQARKLSRKKRQEILSKSNPKPTKTTVKQTVFNRNQYVIAEVLSRAKGICERCNNSAPFIRDIDVSPYLEVHHKKPLAEGGDDTVENAIALCPNCHRHAHYGRSTC